MPATMIFKTWTGSLADWVEIAAALIIALAAIEGVVRGAWLFVRRHPPAGAREELRLRLARWLAVALEFELAADILRTAIAPTWDEIGKLAAIATIRTLLNVFLEREIRQAARVEGITPPGSPSADGTSASRDGGRPGDAERAGDERHAPAAV